MKIVESSFELREKKNYNQMLKNVESAGRLCYNVESPLNRESGEAFVKRLIKMGHESVIEHESLSFLLTVDRATANQLVRHRLFSFSQQSQRYVKYDDIPVIKPEDIEKYSDEFTVWFLSAENSAKAYRNLLEMGVKAETARSVLPNCTATKIVATANLREIRHMLKLRSENGTQIDFRTLARKMVKELYEKYPAFFEDIYVEYFPQKESSTSSLELG